MIDRIVLIARRGGFGIPGIALRFGGSGVLNGLVYAAAFAAAMYGLKASATVSSLAGYSAGLLVGFVLHRRFTFLADGNVFREMLRYGLAQGLTMMAVMAVSRVGHDVFAWPVWLVIASGIVVAPALNFTLMYFWVFTSARNRTTA